MYFSRRRRHTRWPRDWSSDVCSSDLAPTDLRRHVPEPFEAEQLANEDEAVAGAQTLDEVLLHLPQHPLRTLEAHLHHRCRHDDAEIEAVAVDVCRPGHPPAPLVILLQAPEPLVAAQRIAAAGDKLENGIEVRAPQVRIGRGGGHLLVKLLRAERCGAGDAEDMLRENVEPPGAHLFSVEAVGADGLDGRLALQYLEAVARHQQGPARSIEAVIGPAEALQQAGGSLGRSYLYHQIHIPPVDPEIEGGGGDDHAQPPLRHGGFHPAPLLRRQAAMMQGDGQPLIIQASELLEDELGLSTGVHEDQGSAGTAKPLIDVRQGIERHVAGPGQGFPACEDLDLRLDSTLAPYQRNLPVV